VIRNQSSKPKTVQTDWQQKSYNKHPMNQNSKLLQNSYKLVNPAKNIYCASSSLLRTQAKTHTQKLKIKKISQQNFAAKLILEINSNTTTTTTTTMSAFKLFSLKKKTKQNKQ